MITSQILKNKNSEYLTHVQGPLDTIIEEVLPPEQGSGKALIFVSTEAQLNMALALKPRAIAAHTKLKLSESHLASIAQNNISLFKTPSVAHALAEVLPLFDGKMNRFRQSVHIHPTAVVAETAHVASNAQIGPYAVIGENVKIGEHTVIGPHCIVESEAQIGSDSLLHGHIFIGSRCLIGSHCEIHPHTTIGGDGFAFAPQKDKTHKKIPQVGIVRIEDHVEIGSNCAIDRAALTETVIGSGTKFDNFCHVAHNVRIGKNCLIAAHFVVAGSTVIGDNCTFSGNVGVTDHVKICDNVIIAGRGTVSFDIEKPGAYGGFPIEPLKDYLRTLANQVHITGMRKRLGEVEKKLGIEESN